MTVPVWLARQALGQSRRVGGWFLIGVTASLLELALLRLLYENLAWPLPAATAVAAEVLLLVKFAAADRWVFGHARPALNRLMRYHAASAGALLIYWLVVNGLVELLGLPYVAAFIVSTGAAFIWSLVTNFVWVWAKPTRDTR
ncbi:MAG: GtrA family protein [Chloroflexota bacterium]